MLGLFRKTGRVDTVWRALKPDIRKEIEFEALSFFLGPAGSDRLLFAWCFEANGRRWDVVMADFRGFQVAFAFDDAHDDPVIVWLQPPDESGPHADPCHA